MAEASRGLLRTPGAEGARRPDRIGGVKQMRCPSRGSAGRSGGRRPGGAGAPCELGGGLRGAADVEGALGWGVRRVVLGTRALQDPAWCEAVSRRFPGRVALGIDARRGRVATEGWLHTSELSAL